MTEATTLLQKKLNAEINTLRKSFRVVALSKMNSATAAYFGNFLVCKSCIKEYLQALGYFRGFKVVTLGRLYFHVTNFVEIIFSIYYLKKFDKKTFYQLGRTPQDIIKKLGNKFKYYYPVEKYINFRHRLYIKRQKSMGFMEDTVQEQRERIWLDTMLNNKTLLTCEQIIQHGKTLKLSPAVIIIANIAAGNESNALFVDFKKEKEYTIVKDFIEHHYIRSFLSLLDCSPSHLSSVLGYNHADLNAMATSFQDDIERILYDTKIGRLINV